MFVKIVLYFLIFWMCKSSEKYSTKGEKCVSVEGQPFKRTFDQLQCGENKSVYVERVWIDRQPSCVCNKLHHIQTISSSHTQFDISCFSSSYCEVKYDNSLNGRSNKYLHIRFQCKGCKAIHPNNGENILCPAFHNIKIADVSYGDSDCPANKPPRQNIEYFKDQCNDRNTCYVENKYYLPRIASIYFQCEDVNATADDKISTKSYVGKSEIDSGTELDGDSNNPDPDSSTESYVDIDIQDNEISTKSEDRSSIPDDFTSTETPDRSSISDDFTSTESPGNTHYATIAGGIVGGVLLIICIIVGVVLLRRRICTTSGKDQIMTNLNPTYDATHGQTDPDTNQQDHLMSSPDTLYVATSHGVNVDNTTNGDSNTYSHIRNNVDDSDVMYDHTIRHNIHNTCDGDYGIAHRRVTDDDYDVSGNYRQSLSKLADPVYN